MKLLPDDSRIKQKMSPLLQEIYKKMIACLSHEGQENLKNFLEGIHSLFERQAFPIEVISEAVPLLIKLSDSPEKPIAKASSAILISLKRK